jgi:hypothetical protein
VNGTRTESNLDRGHEAASAPRKGFNVTRRLGVVVKRVSHFPDSHAKAVIKLDEGVFRPQALPDFLAGDNLPRPLEEHHEESIGEILDSHPAPIAREAALLRVQFERTKTVSGSSRA